MQINLAETALQNFFAMLDAQNVDAPTNSSQVTLSTLQAEVSPTDANTNTSIVMTAVDHQGFTGSVKTYYKRITLATEAANPAGPVPVNQLDTDAQVLAKIATYFGFMPSEVTLSAAITRPSSFPNTGTASIAATGSLLYVDGTLSVNLNWANANTSLLMHFDGANNSTTFTDASKPARPITVDGAAAISTAQSKFGGSSFLCDATSAGLVVNDSPELQLSGDFTIEFFFNMLSANDGQVMIEKGNFPLVARVQYDAGRLFVYSDQTSNTETTSLINVPASFFTAGVWQHIAIVKASNVWTAYVDGVARQTVNSTDTFGVSGAQMVIGNYFNLDNPMNGYMDELRISRVARYSSDFTPPVAPFIVD